MKTKTFTTDDVAKWLVTFHEFSTKEEYKIELHTIRCIFGAIEDPFFWEEACEKAREMMKK